MSKKQLIKPLQSVQEFLTAFTVISKEQQQIAYVLDQNDKILAVNDQFKQEFLISDSRQILNRQFGRVKHERFSSYVKIFKQTDLSKTARAKTNNCRISLDIIDYRAISRLYIVHRYQIWLEDKLEVTYIQMLPFSLQRYADIIFVSHGLNDEYSTMPTNKYQLTHKQLMILFLFMRNYSYTEISSWMCAFGGKISPARVIEHLENLRNIFKVTNNIKLRKTAILNGYQAEMPAGFLKNGSYSLDKYIHTLVQFNKYPLTNVIPSKFTLAPVSDNQMVELPNANNQALIPYLQNCSYLYQFTDSLIMLTDLQGTPYGVSTRLQLMLDNLPQAIQNSFMQYCRHITNDKANQAFLLILESEAPQNIFIVHKHFLKDETNRPAALHMQFRWFNTVSVPLVMSEIFQIFPLPTHAIRKDYKITEKQHMVLFFYARGYSYTEVSSILTNLGFPMAPSTVNGHLNSLKKMLEVSNREALLDAALMIGHNLLPSILLKQGAFPIDNAAVKTWVC